MSNAAHHRPQEEHRSRSSRRITVRRRTLIWLLVPVLLLVAAVPAILYMQSQAQAAGPGASLNAERTPVVSAQPADRFMQSVVTDDGALGWHQLCPSVQARLPMDELVQVANTQRTAVAQQGIRLTMKFVGTQSRQGGGELRTYIVTAHWTNGGTQTRTFTVLTQQTGCVEDVQNQ